MNELMNQLSLSTSFKSLTLNYNEMKNGLDTDTIIACSQSTLKLFAPSTISPTSTTEETLLTKRARTTAITEEVKEDLQSPQIRLNVIFLINVKSLNMDGHAFMFRMRSIILIYVVIRVGQCHAGIS
jgi:hypothetical protein